MTFQCLKADRRRRSLVQAWNEWLEEADRMYGAYLLHLEDSPFTVHEVAAVGFLSCAAARADFITMNEYQMRKHSRTDRRVKVDGRADLWISKNNLDYSFEFKRAWYRATQSNMRAMLEVVREDIRCVPVDECHYAAGGLIAYVDDDDREPTLAAFVNDPDVDFAYRIGPPGPTGAYLFFSLREF